MAGERNSKSSSTPGGRSNYLRNAYLASAIALMLAGGIQSCKDNAFAGNEKERQEIITKASKLAGHKYVILTSDGGRAENFATINTLQDGSLQIFTNTKVIMINPKTGKIASTNHVTGYDPGGIFSEGKDVERDEKVDDETVKTIVDMCIHGCSQFSVSYQDTDAIPSGPIVIQGHTPFPGIPEKKLTKREIEGADGYLWDVQGLYE